MIRKLIDIKKNNKFIINAGKYNLKLLSKKDGTKNYLSWLNDKKTSEFTYRKNKIFNMKDVFKHINDNKKSTDTLLLGIFKINKHIGNLLTKKLKKKDYPKFLNKEKNIFEISTLIDKKYWQKGVAKEATIYLADFIFKNFDTKIIIFCCFENHFASIIKSLSLGSTICGTKIINIKTTRKKIIFTKLTKTNFYKKNNIFFN